MDLVEPDNVGDERTLLTQFLDHHRSVLARKADGLTSEQLATTVASSDLTLGSLIKHMAHVEDWWCTKVLHDRPMPEPWASAPFDTDYDWDFHSAAEDTPDELTALYLQACERSRAAVAELDDLDAMAKGVNRHGHRFNLRWILIHLIEETARHNGHADFLRESVDGTTGD
jgi:uncharacterized damage-inducible protein DinB